MSLIGKIKSDVEGVAILRDWLGDGTPVHPMVAEARSKRCTEGLNGKPCPMNVEPGWWDRVKSEIANWIRYELELKNQMDLKVPQESKLHMCGACGCCLPLKVWTPIKHIKDHLPADKLNKTPSYCWMRVEIQNQSL